MDAAPEKRFNIGRGFSQHFSALFYPRSNDWIVEVAVVNGDDVSTTHVEGSQYLQVDSEHTARVAVVRLIQAMNMKMQGMKWSPEKTWEFYFGEPYKPWSDERE